MPGETFPKLLMRSKLPRGMAKVSGTMGLLTPSHGEKLAEFSLSCHPLPLCGERVAERSLYLGCFPVVNA